MLFKRHLGSGPSTGSERLTPLFCVVSWPLRSTQRRSPSSGRWDFLSKRVITLLDVESHVLVTGGRLTA